MLLTQNLWGVRAVGIKNKKRRSFSRTGQALKGSPVGLLEDLGMAEAGGGDFRVKGQHRGVGTDNVVVPPHTFGSWGAMMTRKQK